MARDSWPVDSRLADRQREQRLVATRAIIAGVLVLAALALVAVRLARLQVHDHEHFSVLSRDNRVKVQPVPPARGLIYDAKGVVLADNHPSFSLEITIEKVVDLDATIAALTAIIRVDDKDRERFARMKRQRVRFQGVPLRLNLTPEEVARFSLDSYRFPGVEVHAELLRTYPHGELTAHVLGYVGRINEQEMERIDTSDYAGTNFIGKGGVEKAHESLLHGHVGYQQVEVNARGRVLRTLEGKPPVPGRDLHLFLDIEVQRAATRALGDRRGAVVAVDPRTGGVLALVSQPSFDPNPFVEGIAQKDYHALLYSPDKPLYNRAVRGQYPPGSTVKPFVGLAGLVTEVTNARKATYCPGYYRLPGQSHRYRCWRRGGHGSVTLEPALVQSCDVYFYDLAHAIGIERLKPFLGAFGFGARTGIDVAGEMSGLVPSKEWKEQVRKQIWYPGETLIVGIGQGAFLATPLQLAVATASLASRGHFFQPRIARSVLAEQGGDLRRKLGGEMTPGIIDDRPEQVGERNGIRNLRQEDFAIRCRAACILQAHEGRPPGRVGVVRFRQSLNNRNGIGHREPTPGQPLREQAGVVRVDRTTPGRQTGVVDSRRGMVEPDRSSKALVPAPPLPHDRVHRHDLRLGYLQIPAVQSS